jgi:hypothetical protein
MTLLALLALLCAALPAGIFCLNLRHYRVPPEPVEGVPPSVSILIPARDEAAGIARCVQAALASEAVIAEVVVMDDSSTDGTVEIVRGLIDESAVAFGASTLRLEHAPALPPGWNGKQHACWSLAHVASHPILCFVDADVTLGSQAIARMAAFLHSSESALVSGFPQQQTVTWLEQLLLPLIHFVLLGFLPLPQMRAKREAAWAAGCGQFLMVQRDAYFAAGGHAAIRATMHDGIKLPRLFREHGFRTDLADITPLATCRMYRNAREVWNGLAKNAGEGMGSPAAIVPSTLLLVLGQIVPFFLLALALRHRLPTTAALFAILATVCAWLPRLLAIRRFRQPLLSALLHPLGIAALLVIQWWALLRSVTGARVTWKSRAYNAG